MSVENFPFIQKGDDIAEIICSLTDDIRDNDILVIASTIVSKAQGRHFLLTDITPGKEALRISAMNGKDPRFTEAVLQDSEEVFVESPFMLVRTKNGNICINAGIDGSNVEGDFMIRLPVQPDSAAETIGKAVEEKTGRKISVVITDTNGRAFKIGQTNVAVGLYGIHAIRSWIGREDLFGHTLEISEEAVVDEIAGAANLIMGEGNGGCPVVIVRGLSLRTDEKTKAAEFFRKDAEDAVVMGLRLLKENDIHSVPNEKSPVYAPETKNVSGT